VQTPITLQHADVLDVPLQPASVVVMNFTLQFIAADQRDALVRRIADALQPGGIFVLSEKICFADEDENQLQQTLHHAFKFNNGYSQLEISQKRTALENVLVPETLEAHRARLLDAGFSRVSVWFHCFNFMSLVAFR
jgi:tRNA (cmo5U34)-methyltransferase